MRRTLLLGLLCVIALHAEDYCFGFLNTHPERKQIPTAEAEEIQKGHLAHMGRMNQQGHLLAAGPILTAGGPRGIVIYRCESVEEAMKWTSLDPAVQNKRLVLETYRWRGPDGIGEPLLSQLKTDPAAAEKLTMIRLPLIVLRTTDKWNSGVPQEVFAEHMRHNLAMKKDGKLRAAGPFLDSEGRVGRIPGYVGVFVFADVPLEEAKAMIEQDGFVRQGYARVDAYTWMVAEGVLPKP